MILRFQDPSFIQISHSRYVYMPTLLVLCLSKLSVSKEQARAEAVCLAEAETSFYDLEAQNDLL